MTRIIRCPTCAAVYAVDLAQIQAARGWLRCGKCQVAFNGTGLDVSALGPVLMPYALHELPSHAFKPVVSETAGRVPLDDLLLRKDHSDRASVPDPGVSADLMAFSEALATFRPQPPSQDPTPSGSEKTGSAPMRWLYVVATFLALLLMAQVFFLQRHAIAALWPNSLPVLESLCRPLDCQLKPWMSPQALVIEGASFAQSGESFVLTWSLRNTSPMTVATTSLELSLLDAFNNPVARRVFSSGEAHAPERLSPGQVWSGSLTVQVDPLIAFSQYRLLSFYP